MADRLVSSFTAGGADVDLSAIDWGGAAKPADGTTFEQMSPAQRHVLTDSLGYSQVQHKLFVYLGATDVSKRVLADLTPGTDYQEASVAWGTAPTPAAGTPFSLLTLDQQDAVLSSLGYVRWDGPVFFKASTAQYKLSFELGTDFTIAGTHWSAVDVPAAGSTFASLTAEQQATVLAQTGFESFAPDETVFYKADAASGSQLKTTFTLGVDYTDPTPANANATRWLLADSMGHKYIAYAYDGDGNGTVDEIRVLEPHPLFGQRGAGFLLTGTITTLRPNADLTVRTHDDIIIQGNINLLGAGSDLVLDSDRWVYWQGQANIHGDITLTGRGAPEAGKPGEGTSVYVHASSTLIAQAAGADIRITGAKDVELHGALIAGATFGTADLDWLGPDSTISVTAREHILIDTALAAARSVTLVTTGPPGADDKGYGVEITTRGGLTAFGLTGDHTGGLVSITSPGSVSIGGSLLAGGTLVQQAKTYVNWSDESSRVRVTAGGQLWLGAMATALSGNVVEIGGSIRASGSVSLNGGVSPDGIGLRLPGASRIAVHDSEGRIDLTAAGGMQLDGLMVAGGDLVSYVDPDGVDLGTLATNFGGNSAITAVAGGQIRVTRDVMAGRTIDIRGGTPLVAGEDGITVGGTTHLRTWQDDSTISLSAAGNLSVQVAGWKQSLTADSFAEYASGRLSSDASVQITVNLGSGTNMVTAKATVMLRASATSTNTGVADLRDDLQAAIGAAAFIVTASPGGALAIGSTVAVTPNDLRVRLDDGRLLLTSNLQFSVATAAGSDRLGFNTAATSARNYAIDASGAGSVVKLGRANAPAGTITISGAIRAHSGIELYAGSTLGGGSSVVFTDSALIETLQGSMHFAPTGSAVLAGEFIARGAGADIIIDARDTLDLRGRFTAQRDIIINAGTTERAGELSLHTFDTSVLTTLDVGSRIMARAAQGL